MEKSNVQIVDKPLKNIKIYIQQRNITTKMTKINIGTEIDLSKLVATRCLIMGNSGSGKSYTSRRILEESHDKILSIVLDVEGEFVTLREKYDYLIIGEDIPI